MVKEKIKNLAPGAFFNAGPAVVTVLEHFADGRTLLAAKEPIGNRPFTVRPFTYDRTNPEPNPNNFAFSSLRYDLNTDFLDALNAWQLVKELKEATGLPARRVLSALTILQVRQMVAEENRRFTTLVELREDIQPPH